MFINDLCSKNEDDATTFHDAAENGDLERVQFFLGKGVDIDKKTQKYRKTVLYLAASKGHLAIVRCLVEHANKENATISAKLLFMWLLPTATMKWQGTSWSKGQMDAMTLAIGPFTRLLNTTKWISSCCS